MKSSSTEPRVEEEAVPGIGRYQIWGTEPNIGYLLPVVQMRNNQATGIESLYIIQ